MGPTVDEVWVFGSHARGEHHDGSDVDILVVCQATTLEARAVECLRKEFGGQIDIAHYSYAGLRILTEQGALFAWHLRHEGVPVYRRADRLEEMLGGMAPYSRHVEDLQVLAAVFDEAMRSLVDGRTVGFDLGVVATVARNTGIIMHDLLGSRDFSPHAPLGLRCVPGAPAMPIRSSDYAQLYSFRRASERGERGQSTARADNLIPKLEALRPWLDICISCARERRR